LQIRLDEQLIISELLADGELLYVVDNMFHQQFCFKCYVFMVIIAVNILS